MNTIFSLCKLDLYKLLNGGRFTVIVALLSLACVFFFPSAMLFFYYLYFFLSYSVAMTLIALDEQYHCSYLYSALPATRKGVVASRFVFYFVLMTSISVLYLILSLLSPFGKAADSLVLWINSGYCMALIYVGLIQALCYRFKYSSVRMFAVIFFCLLVAALSTIGELPAGLILSLTTLSPTLLALIAAVSGLVIFGLCLFTGQKLYGHKDITD